MALSKGITINDNGEWSSFSEQIFDFLEEDLIEFTIDGKQVRGFRSPDSQCLWIRDHEDMLRAGRYGLTDMKSAVECFANAQYHNGRIFDNVTTIPETRTGERENWEKWVRVPVESDVEYRFAKAVYLAWQATADHSWMAKMLPSVEKALDYTLSNPWRWDPKNELVKRPYTIDTWDFDYTAGRMPWLNFDITEDTFWGIFHGDNSGLYESALLLATMYSYTAQDEKAEEWKQLAEGLKERANNLLFNGRFYTHFYKLSDVTIKGVDEAEQLSLSNPMAINRGLATHPIAVEIIREYQQRAEQSDAFAEWFSIDPPFPDGIFGDDKLIEGAYINGGIFPLAGGELALAAMENGFEEYGVRILRQYKQMIEETGESYLWYFPDGSPSTEETSTSPDAVATDGWGSSAMLYAFVEGLCGIKDQTHSFEDVVLAPRWLAADQHEVEISVCYPASGAEFGYTFHYHADQNKMYYKIDTDHSNIHLHLLLPEGKQFSLLEIDGKSQEAEMKEVENSRYIDADIEIDDQSEVVVTLYDG